MPHPGAASLAAPRRRGRPRPVRSIAIPGCRRDVGREPRVRIRCGPCQGRAVALRPVHAAHRCRPRGPETSTQNRCRCARPGHRNDAAHLDRDPACRRAGPGAAVAHGAHRPYRRRTAPRAARRLPEFPRPHRCRPLRGRVPGLPACRSLGFRRPRRWPQTWPVRPCRAVRRDPRPGPARDAAGAVAVARHLHSRPRRARQCALQLPRAAPLRLPVLRSPTPC